MTPNTVVNSPSTDSDCERRLHTHYLAVHRFGESTFSTFSIAVSTKVLVFFLAI
jgi:hypothetical protein